MEWTCQIPSEESEPQWQREALYYCTATEHSHSSARAHTPQTWSLIFWPDASLHIRMPQFAEKPVKHQKWNGCQRQNAESKATVRRVPQLITVTVASTFSLMRETVVGLRGETATAQVDLSEGQLGHGLATESSLFWALFLHECCVRVILELSDLLSQSLKRTATVSAPNWETCSPSGTKDFESFSTTLNWHSSHFTLKMRLVPLVTNYFPVARTSNMTWTQHYSSE